MSGKYTTRSFVERALFPNQRLRSPKVTLNKQWYRKKLRTINIKLRQEILDSLPFDVDRDKADLILNTIFNSIADEVLRGGSITIYGLGTFYKQKQSAKYKPLAIPDPSNGNRLKNIGKRWVPARYSVGFKAGKSLIRALRKWEQEHPEILEEPNYGTSGKS